MAEGEVRPFLARVEVHVHFREDEIVTLEHVLRAHYFPNAIVCPIEKRLERRLAVMLAGTAGEPHIVGEEALDERSVIACVEESFVFSVVEHGRNHFVESIA
jgi:hypothetical protein